MGYPMGRRNLPRDASLKHERLADKNCALPSMLEITDLPIIVLSSDLKKGGIPP
jgi:hypothetical protein